MSPCAPNTEGFFMPEGETNGLFLPLQVFEYVYSPYKNRI